MKTPLGRLFMDVAEPLASDLLEAVAPITLVMRDEPGRPRVGPALRFGPCTRCGHPCYWSATAPATSAKVCLVCGVPELEAAVRRGDPPKLLTSAAQLRELAEWGL